MGQPLPCDPDEILSYEPVPAPPPGSGSGSIRVLFKDGSETVFTGADAERVVSVLQHVTPPNA